jgi:hypothetical protein
MSMTVQKGAQKFEAHLNELAAEGWVFKIVTGA